MEHSTITISGVLGSGKSTTAKLVAKELGFSHYSGGDFKRKYADDNNLTMAELDVISERDPNIDKLIDQTQKEFMNSNEKWVIDSRLGWFWKPDSFKVFLTLDIDTSTQRIMNDLLVNESRSGEHAHTFEEMKEKIIKRAESEQKRFKEFYNIDDHFDPSHFDLVIDTKVNNKEQVLRLVLEGFEEWKKL